MCNAFVELPPEFIAPLKDVSAEEEDTVTLTCESSKPNVKTTWLKNGKPLTIKDKNKYSISVDGNKHTLVIPKSELGVSGEFTCLMGDVKTQGKVTIEGKMSKWKH